MSPGTGAMRALPLHRLEAAVGLPLGRDEVSTFTIGPTDVTPAEALIAVVSDVLARGPTFVSFSGGRDSSAVLAAATVAARRHGLPDPVPVTQRFAGFPAAEETHWQELVVDHLKLKRWEVLQIDDELDFLGEIARDVLRRHGLLWPSNTHFHVPMLRLARGGSLLTGFDGDGIFGNWRWQRAQAILHRRVRPQRRDVLRVGLALAPPAVRGRLMPAPTLARVVPWLRPSARARLERLARRESAREPRRWDRRLAATGHSRWLHHATHSLAAVAAVEGTSVVHPVLDNRFVSALAHAGGAAGLGDRSAVIRSVFAGVLPDAMLARRSKAEFGAALWSGHARRFAASWDGTGLDLELIDPDRLREAWRAESPLFGSSVLLQLAWLATEGD